MSELADGSGLGWAILFALCQSVVGTGLKFVYVNLRSFYMNGVTRV